MPLQTVRFACRPGIRGRSMFSALAQPGSKLFALKTRAARPAVKSRIGTQDSPTRWKRSQFPPKRESKFQGPPEKARPALPREGYDFSCLPNSKLSFTSANHFDPPRPGNRDGLCFHLFADAQALEHLREINPDRSALARVCVND